MDVYLAFCCIMCFIGGGGELSISKLYRADFEMLGAYHGLPLLSPSSSSFSVSSGLVRQLNKNNISKNMPYSLNLVHYRTCLYSSNSFFFLVLLRTVDIGCNETNTKFPEIVQRKYEVFSCILPHFTANIRSWGVTMTIVHARACQHQGTKVRRKQLLYHSCKVLQ